MDIRDTAGMIQNYAHAGHALKDVVVIRTENGTKIKHKDFNIKFNKEKDRLEIHIES